MKVLVIGHSSYDISCPVEDYPVENTKYRLTEFVSCGGGPAGNAAYLLGKWGVDTYYAGVIGSDDYGNKIKKEFESVGVHTEYLETSYDRSTSLSFIMINKKNGSRTLFNINNAKTGMKKYDFTVDPEIILIDGHEYNASVAAFNKYPNAIKIVDAGRVTPELRELCKSCNYIVSSKGFAETVSKIKIDYTNPNSLVQVYTAIKNLYPRSEIIVTLEEKGALYAINNEIKIMPGLKLPPVDTTGAGDIFHGAFTYAISKGYDLEKSIRYANITAGLSVQKLGARLSIPDLGEVSNYYNEKFPSAPGAASQSPAPQPQVNPNVAVAGQPNTQVANNQQIAQPNVNVASVQAQAVQQPQVTQTPNLNQTVSNQNTNQMSYEQAMAMQNMNNTNQGN